MAPSKGKNLSRINPAPYQTNVLKINIPAEDTSAYP
jgi:hypothetical protein